MGLRNKEW